MGRGNAACWDVRLPSPPHWTGPAGGPVVALSPAEAVCRSSGAEGEQWMAKPFSEKTSAHKIVRRHFE